MQRPVNRACDYVFVIILKGKLLGPSKAWMFEEKDELCWGSKVEITASYISNGVLRGV